MAHHTVIKVRGYHLDLYGHVNNARYLEFLEEARWGLLEDRTGLAWFAERQLALVISRIDIRYKRPATMGDVLIIETELTELRERDAIITQKVVRQDNGKLVAQAEVTFAVIHPDQAGALPITGELAERFAPMMNSHTDTPSTC
ncbi:acyl-CoA thioesterase [Chitinibacter bivalviorum]|uniref:Acyl-CoA thioesterase n=1 Tax=Chitinibacter bivalviorum TaxID=2739434 RepID=A0A7H9BFC8_9NEIS|nr:thioesterase family protein [Chitinibacter bivalviorum]QLG87122.1 acyl-CoA thioesterase [Chitinibacter bivalviorum]